MRNGRAQVVVRLAALVLILSLLALAPQLSSLGVTQGASVLLLAVGDVALCDGKASEDGLRATSQLILQTPGRVAVVGDLAYPFGTLNQFDCYGKYYGFFAGRTYPTPGDHEYYNDCANRKDPTSKDGPDCGKAKPYFQWVKSHAFPSVVNTTIGQGWYTYAYGDWQIYVLNTNGTNPTGNACGWISCDPNSAQYLWLKTELEKHRGKCSLAYWHHALFNSGHHGNATQVQPFWELLDQAHTDIIVNGHEHDYERFAPQTPDGTAQPDGIREFIVGTGGAKINKTTDPPAHPNSEQWIAGRYGVLELTLKSDRYRWEFVDANTRDTLDAGKGTCH
jgi:hypothetical protein